MSIICLTPEQEAKLRKTHESFRCPMGHSQGFYGDNEQERKIKKLENQVRAKEDMLIYYRNLVAEQKAELRSRSARIAAVKRALNRYRYRSHHKKVAS